MSLIPRVEGPHVVERFMTEVMECRQSHVVFSEDAGRLDLLITQARSAIDAFR